MIKDWTDQETQTLKLMYQTSAIVAIATVLGKTPGAVYQRAARIGLRKNATKRERKLPKRISSWKPTYTVLCDKAAALHADRVPLEIRTRCISGSRKERCFEFAIYRIYPRNIQKYWDEYGD